MIMLLHVEINGNLVLCLREIILSNYLHKLHSDNWFTRIQVQAELEKWESSACELSGQMECMAVNSDQKKKIKDVTDRIKGVTTAMKWYDDKAILLLGIFVGAFLTSKVQCDRTNQARRKLMSSAQIL